MLMFVIQYKNMFVTILTGAIKVKGSGTLCLNHALTLLIGHHFHVRQQPWSHLNIVLKMVSKLLKRNHANNDPSHCFYNSNTGKLQNTCFRSQDHEPE